MRDFTKILPWQLAHGLAVNTYGVTLRMRAGRHGALGSQLRRAACSIAANIVEGCNKSSQADYRRFLVIAAASASEAEYHLILARDVSALPPETVEQLLSEVRRVRSVIAGLIQCLDEAIAEEKRDIGGSDQTNRGADS